MQKPCVFFIMCINTTDHLLASSFHLSSTINCQWLLTIIRGRNSGSPVARGYQILLWATKKKTSCSPLVYQTLWLCGRENQQSAVRICNNHLLAGSASLPNWNTLQIAALDALCRMFDRYRHCNCRLVASLAASPEAILTAEYRFV